MSRFTVDQFLTRPDNSDRHASTCAAMVDARTAGVEYDGTVLCDCGYDERMAKRDDMRELVANAKSEHDGLRAEVARLRVALEWYGDEWTWRAEFPGRFGTSKAIWDRGARARAALAGKGET